MNRKMSGTKKITVVMWVMCKAIKSIMIRTKNTIVAICKLCNAMNRIMIGIKKITDYIALC